MPNFFEFEIKSLMPGVYMKKIIFKTLRVLVCGALMLTVLILTCVNLWLLSQTGGYRARGLTVQGMAGLSSGMLEDDAIRSLGRPFTKEQKANGETVYTYTIAPIHRAREFPAFFVRIVDGKLVEAKGLGYSCWKMRTETLFNISAFAANSADATAAATRVMTYGETSRFNPLPFLNCLGFDFA